MSAPGPLGRHDPALVARAHSALIEDGYFVWPTLLPSETVDGLRAALSRKRFVTREFTARYLGFERALAEEKASNSIPVEDKQELAEEPLLQALVADPIAIDIAQRVLECCPVQTQVSAWLSIGSTMDERTLSRAAQQFHQDKDFVKFLKCFVYLLDVEDDTGPHVYVAGSHRDYQEVLGDEAQFGRRYNDAMIAERFGADRFRPLTGPRGSVIFVDTSGYHKGAAVLRDHRLLMQLEWCSSLYMSPSPALDERVLTPDSARLRARAPRFFTNYDHVAREKYFDDMRRDAAKPTLLRKWGRSLRKRLPFLQ